MASISTSLDFLPFKLAVAAQFKKMQAHPMLRMTATKDGMWETYLGSFPVGTDPIFRERTEHNCNCCRSFIRHIGNTVAIVDGQLVSIWDNLQSIDPAYATVAAAMSAYVKAQAIDNLFLHNEHRIGTDKNFEQIMNSAKEWQHFYVDLPKELVVEKGKTVEAALSDPRATHDVMLRGLKELTMDAVDTVLQLMAQGSLYRGDEFKWAVAEFKKLKTDFDKLTTDLDREIFVWSRVKSVNQAVSRIRNSAIGTLLVDLSENPGLLEEAVGCYEAKVAPVNYKRTTALVTPKMLELAKQEIEKLGLMSALDRRFAHLEDITINNVLFADRSSKAKMAGNIFDELAAKANTTPKNLDKVEEVTIEKFMTDILPTAQSLEIMVENRHVPNLMTLITAANPTAGQLFKWGNNFSWDYNGGVTDAIKERVKKAGGNVEGELSCRLAWSNTDDLDFHMIEPGGYEIAFPNKGRKSPNGGMLDVDMNVSGESTTPVENIFYTNRNQMREGVYTLNVHQYTLRNPNKNVGFQVDIDFLGTVHSFVYPKTVRQGETITVARIEYSKKDGVKFLPGGLDSSQATKTVWNVPTQTFQKVNVVSLSPNHWDGEGIGAKHYFFFIDGCLHEGDARGVYNEFLKNEFTPHRKAFDLVGSKMVTGQSDRQLSGLGFSSTVRNDVLVRVGGVFTRTLKVTF